MAAIHAIGIDLGTTYSAVAQLDINGRTMMVRNSQGEVLTPSVVLFDDNEIIVGKEAKKSADQYPDRVAECVKRDMGNATFNKSIRGEFLPPEVIQSCILRKLKNDAVVSLGPNIKAVVTVPAYFDESRRKATADAGEMAGLEVLDIVNEPTAAALAFGETLGYLDPRGEPLGDRTVLVYDLGGGTFDVTVVELRPGNIRTLATDGDVRLGGRDWDTRLADYLAEAFMKQYNQDPRENPAAHARLLRTAEEAKHTLSARDHASVHLTYLGRSSDIAVSRENFKLLSEDLLERTSYTVRGVLTAAGVTWKNISHILLVGGSTRMPMVSELLEEISGGLKPDRNVHPDEAVARGAAIYAGYLLSQRKRDENPGNPAAPGPTFEVTDVNSHSLGIEGVDLTTMRKENVIIIKRNSPLPARKTEKFVTKTAGQQSVVVQVLEGESKMPEQCAPVGRAVMRRLPSGLPKGWPIEVTYEYAPNGRLSVKAKMPGTASDVSIELEREKGLTNERLAKWKVIINSDKGFNAFEAMLEQVLELGGPAAASGAAAESPRPAATAGAPSRPAAASTVRTAPVTLVKVPAAAEPDDEPPPANKSKDTGTDASRAAAQFLKGMSGFGGRPSPAQPSAASPVQTPISHPGALPVPAPRARPRSAEADKSSSRNRVRGLIINVIGFVLTSILGLVAGYYIVTIVKPDSDIAKILEKFIPWHSKSEPSPPAPDAPAGGSPGSR